MCWLLSAFMVTTRLCRCWRRAGPSPVGCGPMFAMIDHLVGRRPRLPCSISRVIDEVSIRTGTLAGYGGGILQADAYAGFGELYSAARKPAPLTAALCWAHGRRNFFKLAQ